MIYRNKNCSKVFIDRILLKELGKLSIKFQNYDNMMDFANILTTITLNCEFNKIDDFEINFAVIYISEKTYYLKDPETKIYLCSIISKNKIYSSKMFWKELIELKCKIHQIDQQINTINLGT